MISQRLPDGARTAPEPDDMAAAADALDLVRTLGIEGAIEVDSAVFAATPASRRCLATRPGDTHLHLLVLPEVKP